MYKGLDVVGGALGVHLDRKGKVVSMGNRFKKRLLDKPPSKIPAQLISPDLAVVASARALGLIADEPVRMIRQAAGADRACEMEGGTISQDTIPGRLAYFVDGNGELTKVWDLVIRPFSNDHWWHVQVDAETGALLSKTDWIKNESCYRVFELPLLNPTEGSRTLHTSPVNAVASPFGWHDTDGIAGAEFTDTRGNNVFAQEDLDANNAGGFRPDGSDSLVFDFPLDLSLHPTTDVSAAVVQLFYMNNILHDLHYQYGFTEAAGNFQVNNYGKGGIGGDPVQVDALDGSGINNANFGTPPDGSDPRMQMFIWRFASLEIDSPTIITGAYFAGSAEFGAQLVDSSLSGTVVQAYDEVNASGPSVMDTCTTLTNAAEVSGHIALIDRGDCDFVVKVKNAQDAGAIGVIIANNAGDGVIDMAGNDPSITIPSIFIGQSDGAKIRQALSLGVRVTMKGGQVGSTFDTGIVIHEYGHGVSTRLTGGAGNSGCLDGVQSGGMGEGLGDWWSIVLTAKNPETHVTPRGVGGFVTGQPAGREGIRFFPYSADLSISPKTFGEIASSSQVHDVGEIWCAVLWDMYWNLVYKHGFDPDFYSGDGGNNVALQLVMDGLKLQPCNPTFLEARDAILSADQVNYGGANQCEIWRAFARRGMGVNANVLGTHNSVNVTEDFAVPEECKAPLITSWAQTSPLQIRWLSIDDAVYRVQQSASLLNPLWTNVSGVVTSAGILSSASLNTNSLGPVFMRVQVQE
jgi:hypothetical protein